MNLPRRPAHIFWNDGPPQPPSPLPPATSPCPKNIQGYERKLTGDPAQPCMLTETTCGPGKKPFIVNALDGEIIAFGLHAPNPNGPLDLCLDACAAGKTVEDPLTGYCVVYAPLSPKGSYRVCPPGQRERPDSSFCLPQCSSPNFLLSNGQCLPCGQPNSQGYPTAEYEFDPNVCAVVCPAGLTPYNPFPAAGGKAEQHEWLCVSPCPEDKPRDLLTGLCPPTLAPITPPSSTPDVPDHKVRNQLLTIGGVAAAVGGIWWWRQKTPKHGRRR